MSEALRPVEAASSEQGRSMPVRLEQTATDADGQTATMPVTSPSQGVGGSRDVGKGVLGTGNAARA